MGSERTTHTLLSVFDLKILDGSTLEALASERIVFIFDQNKRVREFSVVDSKMPHEFQDRLRTWLEKKMDLVQIAEAVNPNTVAFKRRQETSEQRLSPAPPCPAGKP